MTTVPQRYLRTVQQAYGNVPPPQLRFNQEGLVNDVVIVNDEWVFRFPKHAGAKDILRREARVLELVSRHVNAPVPAFETLDDDVATYRYVPGTPLTRSLLLRQSPPVRAALLTDVVRFVQELHAIPATTAEAAGVGPSDTNRDVPWWLAFHSDLQQHLTPWLMDYQRVFLEDLFTPLHAGELDFDYEPPPRARRPLPPITY